MGIRVQHLIETRFSVSVGPESAFQSRAWLRERLEVLREFPFPSLVAQTSEDFTWLLFCDQSADGGMIEELRPHQRDLPFMRLEMTSAERRMGMAVQSLVSPGTDVLITTRLDSDDAIADRYVESVQAYADQLHHSGWPSLLVNFPRGHRLDVKNEELYRGHMPNSMFHSLLEKPRLSPVRSVMAGGHVNLHHSHPTHQDEAIVAR